MSRRPAVLMTMLALILPSVDARPEVFESSNYCSFGGEYSGTVKMNLHDADDKAKQTLKYILSFMSGSDNYELKSSPDVPNARASVEPGAGGRPRRLLIYNGEWLRATTPEERWIQAGVFAHEVGHHVYEHLFGEVLPGQRPQMENDADYHTGWVLSQMDSTLAQAQAAVMKLASEKATLTHPIRNARLDAVASGWHKSESAKWTRRTSQRISLPRLIFNAKPESKYIVFDDDIVLIEPSGTMILVGKKLKSQHPEYEWTYVTSPQEQHREGGQFWDDGKGKIWTYLAENRPIQVGTVGSDYLP